MTKKTKKEEKLPIYVVSIMKNEEKFIERWYNSIKDELRPGDGAFLLDTGSTDTSYELAKSLGITVFKKEYTDWSFAVARNDLREMLPKKDAWLLSLDVDEVLGKGWRDHLDKVPAEVNRPRYNYFWNWNTKILNDDGTPNIEATIAINDFGLSYMGDKIVRRHSHKWVNRVHEVNTSVEGQPEVQGFVELKIYHFADDAKSRGSYLPLLLLDVEENPENDRNTYYAARELMYYGRTEESIAMFKRHLALKSATWNAERAFSMRYIAKQSPVNEKAEWLLKSCAEYPYGRECWVDLAQHYHDTEKWLDCFWAASNALSITNRGDLYLTEAVMWGWLPHDLMALSAAHLDMMQVAVQHGEIALSHAPTDVRLKSNLVFYMLKHSKVDVIIPTKSNLNGLTTLIAQLKADYRVDRIVVVADGDKAYNSLSCLTSDIIKLMVPLGTGIHRMWNIGKQVLGSRNHIAFINDDISLEKDCMSKLMIAMVEDPTIGLICPNYSTEPNFNDDKDRDVFGVSGSRYDGWGGMAGFCFMLAKDLTPSFKFNESLRWLAGDNEIVDWVVEVAKRRAVITHKTRCVHEDSKTFNEDPPADWLVEMHRDKLVYEKSRKEFDNAHTYDKIT